jgi:membrane protein
MTWYPGWLPGSDLLWRGLNLLASLLVFTVLFGLMFQMLPDIQIRWRDVGVGAAVTAILFAAGKELIGLYLGRSRVGSPYGAAGSLVVLLLWIYGSALIVLLGAEFTQVYASWRGRRIQPEEHAVPEDETAMTDSHVS